MKHGSEKRGELARICRPLGSMLQGEWNLVRRRHNLPHLEMAFIHEVLRNRALEEFNERREVVTCV